MKPKNTKSFLFIRIIYIVLISFFMWQVNSQDAIKILPLGNSITQGEGSSVSATGKTYNSWRRDLYKKLVDTSGYNIDFVGTLRQAYSCEEYPDTSFDPDHEGHWSWTIDEIVYGRSGSCSGEGRLGEWMVQIDLPDITLIHIGTNDCWGGQSVYSSVKDLESMIDSLRGYNPDITILLAQIIGHRDISVDNCIQELNDSMEMIALRKNQSNSIIKLVDQYSDFDPHQDCYDSAHPNEIGEHKIAKKWFDALTPFLEASAIIESVKQDKTRIFPNPLINGQILIIENSEIKAISLYGTDGALLEYHRKKNPGESMRLNLNNYSPGLYYIKIDIKEGYLFKRLLIQN